MAGMALWSRGGFLIPVLWACGFWVYAWFEQRYPTIIPDQWVVTIGHLVGTIFVWVFVWIFGYGKAQQMVDVETQEAEVIRRPHAFLMLSAPMWGLILTLLTGWMLYQPPPKSWYDRGVVGFQQGCIWVKQWLPGAKAQTEHVEKPTDLMTDDAVAPPPAPRSVDAVSHHTATPPPQKATMRDWTNDAGKTLRARFVRVIAHADGDRVILERESGEQIEYALARLSASDRAYVRQMTP